MCIVCTIVKSHVFPESSIFSLVADLLNEKWKCMRLQTYTKISMQIMDTENGRNSSLGKSTLNYYLRSNGHSWKYPYRYLYIDWNGYIYIFRNTFIYFYIIYIYKFINIIKMKQIDENKF